MTDERYDSNRVSKKFKIKNKEIDIKICKEMDMDSLINEAKYYAISNKFIKKNYKQEDFKDCFVFSGDCHSMGRGQNGKINCNMAKTFCNYGASVFLGYDGECYSGTVAGYGIIFYMVEEYKSLEMAFFLTSLLESDPTIDFEPQDYKYPHIKEMNHKKGDISTLRFYPDTAKHYKIPYYNK